MLLFSEWFPKAAVILCDCPVIVARVFISLEVNNLMCELSWKTKADSKQMFWSKEPGEFRVESVRGEEYKINTQSTFGFGSGKEVVLPGSIDSKFNAVRGRERQSESR